MSGISERLNSCAGESALGSNTSEANMYHHRGDGHPGLVLVGLVAVVAVLIAAFFQAFTTPYGLMGLWKLGTTWQSLWAGKLLLIVTALSTAYCMWLTPALAKREKRDQILTFDRAWEHVLNGFVTSAMLWVIVLLAAWVLSFLDVILGGFLGAHFVRWLQNGIVGPAADWLSLGFATDVVNNPARWSVSFASVLVTALGISSFAVVNKKEGYTPLAALMMAIFVGLATELVILNVLLVYGVWATGALLTLNGVVVDGVRLLHQRTEPNRNQFIGN